MPKLSVYELRNYIMAPGRRDDLIALFEAEFIEAQEGVGAHVAGTFRDLNNPERFVWLRGFETIERRAAALDAFYTSALWLSRRTEANATIVDNDDVLQLRPVSGDIAPKPAKRPPIGASDIPPTLIVATTFFIAPSNAASFASFYAEDIAPVLRDAGAEIVATFSTEPASNSYPRLPIRDQETVFVSLTRFASISAHRDHLTRLRAPDIAHLITAPTHVMRLQPTARSSLR